MIKIFFWAATALYAAAPLSDTMTIGAHRLIVAEQFDKVDAMARAILDRAQGSDEATERRRLDALNVLIDSAIAQHTLTSDACGLWIDEASKLDAQLYGPNTRRLAKPLAALSLRTRRAASGSESSKNANALAQQSLDHAENGTGQLRPSDEAFVYQAVAAMHLDGGRFDKAAEALQHADKALESSSTDYEQFIKAQVLTQRATYELQIGSRAQAMKDARAGVDLALKVGGPSSRMYAAAQTDLGKIQFFSTDYVVARETLQRAVEILRKYPAETYTASIANGFLANAQIQLGDPDAARPSYRDAIADSKGDATSLLSGRVSGLAVLEKMVGHLDSAHDLFQRSLAIDEQLHDKNFYGLVPTLNNLGMLSLKRDDLNSAQSEFRRALDIAATRGNGGDIFAFLAAREGLALVALARGAPGEADALLAQSVNELKQSYGDTHPFVAFMHCSQALARARLGQRDDAFVLAQSSDGFRVDLELRTAPALGESEMVNLKASLDDCGGLVAALAAASQKDNQIQRAWQLLAGSRGLATHLSSLRLAAARKSTDASNKEAWSVWEAAAKRYAELLLKNKVDLDTLSKARVDLDAAQSQLGASEKSALGITDLVLASLLQHQPPASALVAYFVTDQFDLDANARTDPEVHGLVKSPHTIYAFVRQNEVTRLISLGDSDAIEFKIAYWNRLLRDSKSDLTKLSEAGRAVRKVIWDPLGIGKMPTQVLVIPDGAVYRVNFAALPDGDGYLVERGLRVHLLDSERDLAMDDALAPPTKILLVESPDFGGSAKRFAERSNDCATAFDPLPGTKLEVDQIAQLWSAASGEVPVILSGRRANKETLRAAIAGNQVIHIATHAAEFDEGCKKSAARGMGLAASRIKPSTVKAAALALTGANEFLSTGDTAGILTSEEVLSLPLDGTQWVVLSACDTGLGPVIDGEGVFGLRRAFRLAGANTVVMSLWEADDIATSQWMQALYRARLQDHASVPDSIAQAQLAVLADRRVRNKSDHPYFWAAFVASGDWH